MVTYGGAKTILPKSSNMEVEPPSGILPYKRSNKNPNPTYSQDAAKSAARSDKLITTKAKNAALTEMLGSTGSTNASVDDALSKLMGNKFTMSEGGRKHKHHRKTHKKHHKKHHKKTHKRRH